MALKVSVNHPAFPEGHNFTISGLGVIPNGGSIEVTEEQERNYLAETGTPLSSASSGGDVNVEGDSLLTEDDIKALMPSEISSIASPDIDARTQSSSPTGVVQEAEEPVEQETPPVEVSAEEAATIVNEGGES